MPDIAELLGKTLTKVEGKVGDTQIIFTLEDGTRYSMSHIQECCESVDIEDICGDLTDLVGSALLRAEESSTKERPEGVHEPSDDEWLWTFYRFATIKGSVVIRWFGSSNGYYGVEVSIYKLYD
jgi:hypothetical protein